MRHTQPSVTTNSNAMLLCSSCHHTILTGFFGGKIYQTAAAIGAIAALPGAGAASTGGAGGSILRNLTGDIDRAMTSTKSSEMSSFLVKMRNALGN
jgi:hypothetical protein